MIVALLVLCTVVVALLVGLLVAVLVRTKSAEILLGPEDELIREHLLERYVITVQTGEAFAGLLADVDDRTLILREAVVMTSDGKETAVSGELTLRRDAVAYMQRP